MESYDTKYFQEMLRGSSLILIYIIVLNLTGIVYIVIATRILSMFEVGALLFASVIINFFPVLFGLALHQAAPKFCAEKLKLGNTKFSSEISNLILTLGLILFLIALPIGYFFVYIIVYPLLPIPFLQYYSFLVALDGSLNLLLFLFYVIFIGNLKIFNAVFSLSLASAARFLSAAFIIHLGGSIFEVLKFWIIGDSLGILSFIFFSRGIVSLRFTLNLQIIKQILNYSLPLYISLILNYTFLYIDRYQVAYNVKLENFSIYGTAMTASMILINIPQLLSNVLVPYFSYAYVNKKEEFYFYLISISRFACLTFLPLLILISMLAEPIIYLFAGSKYIEGWVTFFMVTLTIAISFPIISILAFFLALGKTKIVMYSSMISLSIGVIFIQILSPQYGILGASIGRSLIFALNFIFLAIWLYYKEKIDYGIAYHIKISLISSLIFSPILIANNILKIPYYYLSLIVILSIMVYFYILRKYRLVLLDDLKRLSLILPDNISKRLNNFFYFLFLKKNKNKN